LIESEPHDHRRAQLHPALRSLVSPLRELDFRDEFRTHKLNFAQSANLTIKRSLFRLKRLHAGKDFLERLLIEPSSNLPNVNQPPQFVVKPKHERPEIFAAALRIGVASDNALLTLRDFDLEPIARALFFVSAAAFLGDDAFQSALLCRFEKIKTFLGIVVGKLNYAALASDDPFLQQLLAFVKRDAAQVEAIKIEQIESVVDNRYAFAPWQTAIARMESGPLLHEAKRRSPLVIERDD